MKSQLKQKGGDSLIEFDKNFEKACEEYLSYLYCLAEKYYSDCPDMDSLVQDTLTALIIKVNRGEAGEHPKGFLTAVLKNKYNGFLQVGFELHYSKMYQKVKEWIDEGKLGDVVNVQCRYYCCEFHKKNSWRSKNYGSFLIGEKLSHYLDLQRWFLSNTEVHATVYSLSAPKVVEYFNHRDNHQIMTKYSKGGVATLNFIMYFAETHKFDPLVETLKKQSEDGHFLQYHICGTKGGVETDVFRRRIRRYEYSDGEENIQVHIKEVIEFEKEEDQIYFHNTHGQNLRVIELVAKGLPPEVPAEDALETMRLCFAAEKSEDAGGEIVKL